MPRLLGSLRGLRVQLLLWLVLPLTLALVVVAITGINVHQSSMRQMVEELSTNAKVFRGMNRIDISERRPNNR